MKRLTIGKLALLTALAVGLIAVTAAWASSTNNARWKVNGKALGAGETKAVTGSAEGTQVLTATGIKIECEKLEFVGGKLVGTAEKIDGKGEGSIKYTKCVEKEHPTCKVLEKEGGTEGTILTKELTTTQVWLTKAAAEAGVIAEGANGTVFAPKSGTVFAEFFLSGEACAVKGKVTVNGVEGKAGVIVKDIVGLNEELEVHLIEAPSPALTVFFLNTGPIETKEVGIKVAGLKATYSGKAAVSVGTGNKYNLTIS